MQNVQASYIFLGSIEKFFLLSWSFSTFLKDFFISSFYRSAWRRSYYWNPKKAVSSRRNCRSDVYCPNFQPGHKFVMVHQWWTGKISIFCNIVKDSNADLGVIFRFLQNPPINQNYSWLWENFEVSVSNCQIRITVLNYTVLYCHEAVRRKLKNSL